MRVERSSIKRRVNSQGRQVNAHEEKGINMQLVGDTPSGTQIHFFPVSDVWRTDRKKRALPRSGGTVQVLELLF